MLLRLGSSQCYWCWFKVKMGHLAKLTKCSKDSPVLLSIDDYCLSRNKLGAKCLIYHWKKLIPIKILHLSIQ